jgi:hypothetical protein
MVLSTSGAMAGKSSNRASWDWFCRLLEPWPESHQIEPPGIGFVEFWSHSRKVIKSSFWDWFCRLLEPWLESHQIESPGIGFVDFWSHGRKVIKSSFLGLVLSTSGAMAGKSSNRASWDWFCRLLEPWPESHQIEPLGIGFVDFLSQC